MGWIGLKSAATFADDASYSSASEISAATSEIPVATMTRMIPVCDLRIPVAASEIPAAASELPPRDASDSRCDVNPLLTNGWHTQVMPWAMVGIRAPRFFGGRRTDSHRRHAMAILKDGWLTNRQPDDRGARLCWWKTTGIAAAARLGSRLTEQALRGAHPQQYLWRDGFPSSLGSAGEAVCRGNVVCLCPSLPGPQSSWGLPLAPAPLGAGAWQGFRSRGPGRTDRYAGDDTPESAAAAGDQEDQRDSVAAAVRPSCLVRPPA